MLMLILTGVAMATEPQPSANEVGSFMKDNWVTLLFALLGFVEVVVRLTPTKKDDSILNFILKIINAIFPNRKKEGGTHV